MRDYTSISRALGIAVILLCINITAAEYSESGESKWIAPLFISNEHVQSLLTIENSGNHRADLIATFESLEGQQVASRSIQVNAHSNTTVDIGRVATVRHRFPDLGSITVTGKTKRGGRIGGHITITSADHHFSIEEPLQLLAEEAWLSQRASVEFASGVPVLAIHNLAATSQTLSIECTDELGQSYESEMTLPPHMTFLRNACISGRREGRTYQELLRGEIGATKGRVKIRIAVRERQGGMAVWGLAGVSGTDSNLKIASILFSE